MERFVQLVTAGGVALVAGLWVVTLFDAQSAVAFGAAFVLLGVGGLAAGIWLEIDY